MEIKKVIKQDGEYQCDIDVTVDEWKRILQDKTIMNKNYVDVLLKFYSEPEHKSTCKELGIKYDKSPQSFNSKHPKKYIFYRSNINFSFVKK